MSEHTKEPWYQCGYEIEADDGTTVCNMSGWKNKGQTIADAKRIVACVNACEGIPTDELVNQVGAGMKIKFSDCPSCNKLTAQRELNKELVDALKYTLRTMDDYQLSKDYWADMDALIAKAEANQ